MGGGRLAVAVAGTLAVEGRLGLAVQGRLAVAGGLAGADRLVVAEPETRKHFPPTAARSWPVG